MVDALRRGLRRRRLPNHDPLSPHIPGITAVGSAAVDPEDEGARPAELPGKVTQAFGHRALLIHRTSRSVLNKV